jgi:hypothetical protein
MFSLLHIAVSAIYLLLLLWHASRSGIDMHAFYLLVGFVALRHILLGVERFAGWWQVRAIKRDFLSLDPDAQADVIRHSWLGEHRRAYRDLIEQAGAPTKAGAVERFPFPATSMRENAVLFWLVATFTIAVLAGLFLVRAWAGAVAWALWALCFAAAGLLAWLRARGQHLRSVLEISPFVISITYPDGTRRALQWSGELRARNHRWRRRVDLFDAAGLIRVPLDYGRLSFNRIADLVLEYSGWSGGDAV